MDSKRIYTRGWRVRKAYWITFTVMMSYVRLYLLGKLFGSAYYQKRIIALHIRNAQKVKNAILKLQGLFIKVGQLLSILSNFLPESFQEPLEALQDQVPPRPLAEIRQRIVAELGKEPAEIFEYFDETAIASASIGQVHRARLKDQTEVAVKVQHANIEKIAEVDLQIMERIIGLVARFMDIKGLRYAYTQVRKMIEEELDFEQEASSMKLIGDNLSEETGLLVPEVHKDFSTKRILTTTFYPGVKINQVKQIEDWGLDRKDLAKRIVHAYCQMVFEDGFYHADPHPGNILIQEDGTLVLLDFGAVSSLKPEMRTGLLELIQAAAKNDVEKIIAAMKLLGFITQQKEAEQMAEKMVEAFRNFVQNEVQFDGLSFKDIKVNPFETSLFELITEVGFKNIANTVQVPKDYVLLNRMVTLLLGICNTLDTHMNPMEVIQPYFQKFLLGEKGDLVKFVTGVFQQTLANIISLPGEMRKLMNKAHRGELEINQASNREKNRLFYTLGQQFLYAILMIVSSGFCYSFYQFGNIEFSRYAMLVAAFFLFLMFRAIRRGNRIGTGL
ncbi:MAG: ABC transporter [Saprospiraceae bacterium]|nr:MAG: ABC transporter [Saprospiraceae bacterium]